LATVSSDATGMATMAMAIALLDVLWPLGALAVAVFALNMYS